MVCRDALFLVANPQIAVNAGGLGQIHREILSARHFFQRQQAVAAKLLLGGLLGQRYQLAVIVDQGVGAKVIVAVSGAAVHSGGALYSVFDQAGDLAALLTVKRAAGAHDLHMVGQNIHALAAVHGAHGEHQRVARVVDAAHDALNGHHGAGGSHHGILAQKRGAAVAGFAMDLNGKAVAAGHAGAGLKVALAHGQMHPYVHTENGIDVVQRAALYIFLALAADLLGHLENQLHGAAKLIALLHQHTGRAQQHGGVAVVPAGMHYAGVYAGVGHLVFLLHGQSIDIGAQHHGFAGLCAVNGAHAPGNALKGLHLHADFFQLGANEFCGFDLLAAQLGVGVQPAPGLDHIVLLLGSQFLNGHCAPSFAVCSR